MAHRLYLSRNEEFSGIRSPIVDRTDVLKRMTNDIHRTLGVHVPFADALYVASTGDLSALHPFIQESINPLASWMNAANVSLIARKYFSEEELAK